MNGQSCEKHTEIDSDSYHLAIRPDHSAQMGDHHTFKSVSKFFFYWSDDQLIMVSNSLITQRTFDYCFSKVHGQ